MSVMLSHACSTPSAHVLGPVHVLQGAYAVCALNEVPGTQGARGVQQSSSVQIIPLHDVDASFPFLSMGHWWVAHLGSSAQQSPTEHVDEEHRRRALLATVLDGGQVKLPHCGRGAGIFATWPGTTGAATARATSTMAGMLVTVRTLSEVNTNSSVPFPLRNMLWGENRYLRGTRCVCEIGISNALMYAQLQWTMCTGGIQLHSTLCVGSYQELVHGTMNLKDRTLHLHMHVS